MKIEMNKKKEHPCGVPTLKKIVFIFLNRFDGSLVERLVLNSEILDSDPGHCCSKRSSINDITQVGGEL